MTVLLQCITAVHALLLDKNKVVTDGGSSSPLHPDVEKVAAPGNLVPRRNLGRRRILCLFTAFVAKITTEGGADGLAEG